MKHFASFALAASLAFAVSGCSGDAKRFWDDLGVVSGTVAGATVPGYTVVAAVQSFDGLELVGASYLGLRRCSATSGPLCRVPGATPILKGASQSGRVARATLESQLRAVCAADFAAGRQCTAGIPVASYNTLIAANKTIDDATAAYRAATGK